jgi:hypothetical protein
VDQIKRYLVLKASTDKGLEELLIQFIAARYKLDVTDHSRRCPLHLAAECVNDAAVSWLVGVRSDLVILRDDYGSTPLHTVVRKAVNTDPKEEERAPFRAMIGKLLYALAENQHPDNLADISGRSPWEYATGVKYSWIRSLREEFTVLLDGARAAVPETIKDLVIPPTPIQIDASRKSVATLAQLYIAKDGSKDYLEMQRPDVYSVIYDQQYAVEKWWDRNLLRGQDKRATCRWIHLPANNVSVCLG